MIPDVVVVGAGLIGCSAARLLSSAGVRVVLVDRNPPCREASYAAAGMLAVHVETGPEGPFFDLCRRSRALFPDFISELYEETGLDAELARAGTVVPLLDDEDEAHFRSLERGGAPGARVERLSPEDLARLEPWLAPDCRFGWHLPDDIRVNNRRLCDAVVASLEARGVSFRLGRPAHGLLRSGSAVSGVRLAGGDGVKAGAVLLSAGAWSGGLDGLPRPLPVEPRRGQMLALRAPAGVIRHNLFSTSAYVVPRIEGSVFVGATVERVGFDKRVTADGVAALLAGARRIAPRLGSAELLETWAGLRPGTPDDLPILGLDPEVSNLFYATGHFRNGVLLAPITAQIVLEGLTGVRPSVALDPFRPDRFAATHRRGHRPTDAPQNRGDGHAPLTVPRREAHRGVHKERLTAEGAEHAEE